MVTNTVAIMVYVINDALAVKKNKANSKPISKSRIGFRMDSRFRGNDKYGILPRRSNPKPFCKTKPISGCSNECKLSYKSCL